MTQGSEWPRRAFLGAGLAALASSSLARPAHARESGKLSFRLFETAGLRRFGYPVHAELPPGAAGPNFRLERNGKAVPAQFRTVAGTTTIALDFNASPAPLTVETYEVFHGPEVEPGPEPSKGMAVERLEGGDYLVANGSILSFRLPANQDPSWLGAVRNGRQDYLKPNPLPSLVIVDKDGGSTPLSGSSKASGPARVTITRQGPFAVGLRIQREDSLPSGGVASSTIDLTFPNSKSWVEASWTVDDPKGQVRELVASTQLKLEGDTALVDLGANDTVYTPLRKDEWVHLTAGKAPGAPLASGRAWEIVKGRGSASDLFALASESDLAEGWAHVMDEERCAALAVANFGRDSLDVIKAYHDGRLAVRRAFSGPNATPREGPKSLRFWLHFVSMPVQVGAATSPQAMLSPLGVAW